MLWWLGKFTRGLRSVGFSCKDVRLKHVQSLRRQVYVSGLPESDAVSFRVKHEDEFYMVYASSRTMKSYDLAQGRNKDRGETPG